MKIIDIISAIPLSEGPVGDILKGVFKVGAKDSARELAKKIAAENISKEMVRYRVFYGRNMTSQEAYAEAAKLLGPERLKDQKFMQEVFDQAEKLAQAEIKNLAPTGKAVAKGSQGSASAASAVTSGLGNRLVKTGLFAAAAADTAYKYHTETQKLLKAVEQGQLSVEQFNQEDRRNKINLVYGLAADLITSGNTWFTRALGTIPILGRPFRALANRTKDSGLATWAFLTLLMHYPRSFPGPSDMQIRNGSEFLTWLLFVTQRPFLLPGQLDPDTGKPAGGLQLGLGWSMGGESMQEIDAWISQQANKAVAWANANAGTNISKWQTNPERAAQMIDSFKPTVPGKPGAMDASDSEHEASPAKPPAPAAEPKPTQPAPASSGTTLDWNTMKK